MKLTLTLNDFDMMNDTEAVINALSADGQIVMSVMIDFEGQHSITTDVMIKDGLPHYSQARIILAASDLLDAVFTGEELITKIEV